MVIYIILYAFRKDNFCEQKKKNYITIQYIIIFIITEAKLVI